MNHLRFLVLTIISSLALSILSTAVWASEAPVVTKYQVSVPEKYYVAYPGPNRQVFPRGFLTGYGSALAFKGISKDGVIEFYGLTDRGPNGDGPEYETPGGIFSSKFFPSPRFQPQIALIRIQGTKAEVTGVISLKDAKGRAITGLPLAPGLIGATNEIALDETFHNLGYDNEGMDPEGLAIDSQGNFWICDEYGPFIAQYNKAGKLLKKYAPGKGLPEIMKYRTPNRGFEGLTLAPNGLIYAAEQSPLNLAGKAGATARFTRIVALDPQTGKTKMFAYPIDVAAYNSPNDAKIGDIYAISDSQFLVIEQGTDKGKQMRNLIYLVDIKGATDLTGKSVSGKEPEYATTAAELRQAGITLATKRLVVDLRALGWDREKAEGLTMLPDKRTIVVTNDNDFALSVDIKDAENKKAKVGNYVLHPDGSFTSKGKPAQPTIRIIPAEEDEKYQTIWFIKLPAALP